MTVLAPAEFGPKPTQIDNANHTASPDKWWQESILFTWTDVEKRTGGEIRFGMHANQGVANLYSWTLFNGEMVDRRLVTEQSLPQGELSNATIAGACLRTIEPLMEFAISLSHDDLELELKWRNFRHPLTMGFNVGGATIANGHYNAMGEATGFARYRGQELAIHGYGFSDHSWGVRKSHLPASRSLFCVFDADFYLMAIPISTGTARTMVGYSYKDGLLGRLNATSEMGYCFRDDWITPASCNAKLFDEHGRGCSIWRVRRSASRAASRWGMASSSPRHLRVSSAMGGPAQEYWNRHNLRGRRPLSRFLASQTTVGG